VIALFLGILIAIQGPALPQTGKVTGILRTAAGTPAVRVRVAASDISTAALVSLSETDQQGRFVLENIPPGRYYIVAGRVDLPTFYPGTLGIANGTILEIASGAAISGISFAVNDASTRPPLPGSPSPPAPVLREPQMDLPIRIKVEGEGTMALSTAGQSTRIQLTARNSGKGSELALDATNFTIPDVSDEYDVRLVNLPNGYVVTSMTFNGADLMNGPLKAPTTPPFRIITFTGEGKLQSAADRRAGIGPTAHISLT
jgi:hypothetical protein